jgi:hypothetical protein
MELFGFKIEKNNIKEEPIQSPVPRLDDDGALILDSQSNPAGSGAQAWGVSASFDANITNESNLITKYREIAQVPEVDYAIDDIINEMMSIEKNNDIVDIDLDELSYSEAVKEKITSEFQNVLTLLDFNNKAYEITRRWYEDGRINYYVIIDENYKKDGIKELRYVDPRTIRKVRQVKQVTGRAEAILEEDQDEYYIYSPDGFSGKTGMTSTSTSLKIAADSIVYVTSGLMNHNNTMVLSLLHKAIRPLNQLRALEDASIIYRISRAPERRVFYIDVGNLPRSKAEQHLKDVATRYKNKLVYDQSSGEIRDDRKFMTMSEDYFLPRRTDGKATEITTLPGGQQQGEMEQVEYFRNQLYRALNVPLTRLDSTSTFQFGRQTEISRDEVKFAKFIGRQRKRFSLLLLELLGKQLILKNIMQPEEFTKIRNLISFEYSADNLFSENKEMEIFSSRLDILERIEPFKGLYLSKESIQRKILRMSQEDIDNEQKLIDKEKAAGVYDDDNEQKIDNIQETPPEEIVPPVGGKPAAKPATKSTKA